MLTNSAWNQLFLELHRANPSFCPYVVGIEQRLSTHFLHHGIQHALSTWRHRANPSVRNDCLRDRDEGAPVRAFQPRGHLTAIECRDGALACALGVLLHVEGAVDRFGRRPCLTRSSKVFPSLRDRTRNGMCISCEGEHKRVASRPIPIPETDCWPKSRWFLSSGWGSTRHFEADSDY